MARQGVAGEGDNETLSPSVLAQPKTRVSVWGIRRDDPKARAFAIESFPFFGDVGSGVFFQRLGRGPLDDNKITLNWIHAVYAFNDFRECHRIVPRLKLQKEAPADQPFWCSIWSMDGHG